jgi:hypothetical protein
MLIGVSPPARTCWPLCAGSGLEGNRSIRNDSAHDNLFLVGLLLNGDLCIPAVLDAGLFALSVRRMSDGSEENESRSHSGRRSSVLPFVAGTIDMDLTDMHRSCRLRHDIETQARASQLVRGGTCPNYPSVMIIIMSRKR